MRQRQSYLLVDGHSVIFAWPDLLKMHERRTALARDELAKRLRHYQDWTGTHMVAVFDGKGAQVSASADPHDIQIFYSRRDQTADAIIERLASKYAERFRITVVTADNMVRETAAACGAEVVSPDLFREMMGETVPSERTPNERKNRRTPRSRAR